jgi:hypothetical protein
LPENFCVAVLVSLSRQASRDFGGDAEFFVFQGCGEAGKIGGEPTHHAKARTERENGEACAGRNLAEIFDDLLPGEGLILRLCVEEVEQQKVDGISTTSCRKIAEDVGRHRRQLHFVRSRAFVFLERSDKLRAAVLGDVKVILVDAGNGSLFVCDNHVHHDDATFDFDCRALNRRGNRRPLLAGLRETDP